MYHVDNCYWLIRMQQAMSSVLLRVKHSDPNIQLHALTVSWNICEAQHHLLYLMLCKCSQLLEACVSNCGKDFQLELTKPSFQSDIKGILTGVSVLCVCTLHV